VCLWGRSAANESAGQYLSTISGAIPLPRASVTAVKTFFSSDPQQSCRNERNARTFPPMGRKQQFMQEATWERQIKGELQ